MYEITKWDKIEETKEDNEQRIIQRPQDEIISGLVSTVNRLVDEIIDLRVEIERIKDDLNEKNKI